MRLISNHLVFRHDNPESILELLPMAKEAQGWVAVPFTIQTAHVLQNLGYNPPSPITADYDWPGKYKPYKHQIKTAEHFTLNRRCFCENDPGSGKTMSALWAIDYLKRLGLINRVLIISPLSTLSDVWGREIFTNFPNRSFAILHGTADKRKKLLAETHDIYVVNPQGVVVLKDELLKRSDINLILIDEVAFYRSSTGKTKVSWAAARSLISPNRWVWGMTGTPTPNAPTDAYGIVKLVRPENVPYSFTRFKCMTMLQVSAFKWVPRSNAEEAVRKILSPSIRFALRDCIELPPTINHYRHVEITAEQQVHYTKLLKECVTEYSGITVTAVNAAVLIMRLVQAAMGCMYGENKEIIKIDCKNRIDTVEEVIDEFGGKVILFVPFTGALHMVKAELEKRKHKCCLVEGATSSMERQRIFDTFRRDPEMRVLCANASAMSHGINLTCAATTIWYAPIYSGETYLQANARTVRSGQTKVTNIVNLYSVKEELRIYEALREKIKFQDLVLEMVK